MTGPGNRGRAELQAAAWRSAGERVAVATVTETWDSLPRPAGSQLAITLSGKMAGWAR